MTDEEAEAAGEDKGFAEDLTIDVDLDSVLHLPQFPTDCLLSITSGLVINSCITYLQQKPNMFSYNGFIRICSDCDYLWGVSETSQKKSRTFGGRVSESQQPMQSVLYNPIQC